MFIYYKTSLIFMHLFILFCILQILALAVYWFSIPDLYSSEKLSTYECGFIPLSNITGIFETSFCILAVVFLLFDLELLFLMPWVATSSSSLNFNFFVFYCFFVFLGAGLLAEWDSKVLYSLGSR